MTHQIDLIKKLKFTISNLSPFTLEEQEFIINNSSKFTIREIADKLNYKWDQVWHFIKTRKLSYKSGHGIDDFTKNYILNNYKKLTMTEIAKEIGKNKEYVYQFYKDYNIKDYKLAVNREIKLTEQQIEYILNNYKKLPLSDISKKLGIKYEYARQYCRNKGLDYIRKMKKYTFTDNERSKVLKLINENKTINETSNITGLNYDQVLSIIRRERNHGKEIKINYEVGREGITEEDKDFILKNYNEYTVPELAKMLNYSYKQIYSFCKIKKISCKRECRKPFTEIEKLRELAKSNTLNELIEIFQINRNTLISILTRNNIKPVKRTK